MKKFYILMVVLFMVMSACQRSQFATTTRHSKNGKVTYVNHYPTERTKSSKVTVHKSHLKELDGQNNTLASDRTGVQNLSEPEITTITPSPMPDNENLIASTQQKPTLIVSNHSRIAFISPDTIKNSTPQKGKSADSLTQTVIKFKNGQKETVKIVSQPHDTLKYESISAQGIVRTVTMEQIDTIIPAKSVKPVKVKNVNTRKTERVGIVGLVFSILGFVPAIGILFAILGIIFSGVSLGKIHRQPERFKGKGIAIAGLFIGILALIINIIFVIGGFIGFRVGVESGFLII